MLYALDCLWRFLLPSAHLSTYFGQRFVNPDSNLLRGKYRVHLCAYAEAFAEHVKDFEIFRCPHFEEKKKGDKEIKS